ncbi:MAG: hypothetical protein Q8L47_02250 [bacterium]|nr:hypothetical protein [bacterium]
MRVYLFLLPIAEMGEETIYSSLPLHCTLMPWFKVNATPEELVKKVSPVFKQCGFIKLVSTAPAFFGKKKDIQVHKLAPNPPLKNLHLDLWKILNKIGVEYIDTSYIANNYIPHVTTKGRSAFRSGRRHTINSVSLVEALDSKKLSPKKLVARISLL